MTALLAAALASVDQEYLFEARQMQALSFAVHIPLVCFSPRGACRWETPREISSRAGRARPAW